jgi:hypothetical protein
MSAKKATQKSAKRTTAINKKSKGFTGEERAAMKERAQELKAAASKADGESAVLAKIAEMLKPDRAMGRRLHGIIKPGRQPSRRKPGTGCPRMPRTAGSSASSKARTSSKSRYATFGFTDKANLDEGAMWPLLRAEGVDRRRRGNDRQAREESGELSPAPEPRSRPVT